MNNKSFDFEKFVKQNAESDLSDLQELVNSPQADDIGEYCIECVTNGYQEMSSRFTDDEITLITTLAMSTAISFEMKNSGDLSSLAIVLGSKAVRRMVETSFFYALGMSIKEEIR